MAFTMFLIVMYAIVAQAINPSCYQKPSQAICAQFKHPAENAAKEAKQLCKSMPYMTACSVLNVCRSLEKPVVGIVPIKCMQLTCM
jgi:hypothetical protein